MLLVIILRTLNIYVKYYYNTSIWVTKVYIKDDSYSIKLFFSVTIIYGFIIMLYNKKIRQGKSSLALYRHRVRVGNFHS